MKAVIETFKDIPGYEGLYQVSDYGCVRSLNYRHTGNIGYLKNTKNRYGYENVCLCLDGKHTNLRINRLVYEAFNGPIPDGYEIDHINGVKDDNRLVNLRCVTPKENQHNPVTRERHLISIKKRSENQTWQRNHCKAARDSVAKPVLQLEKQTGKVIREWECAADVERELGIYSGNISKCCNGKYKTTGGFRWKFAD